MTPTITTASAPPRRRGRVLARVSLCVWAIALFLVTTTLAAAHWYSLPGPDRGDPGLASALALQRPAGDRRWLTVHVLYAHCRCSQRIVAHLVERRALADASEHALLVGSNADLAEQLRAAGYGLSVITPRELGARYGIVAVPMLIVLDPGDQLRYAGGYTTHKQGPDVQDVRIVRGLMRAQTPGDLPLFGCAVSRSLQRLLDPFALKYSSGEDDDR